MGVLGNDGQPMKESRTINGNFKELSKLDSYCCDGSHEHDQSRGKALKLAENFTFKLTDMLHECFRVAARGQASKRKACSAKFACPVKMADSRLAASPASREAAPDDARRQRNKKWWADFHGTILYTHWWFATKVKVPWPLISLKDWWMNGRRFRLFDSMETGNPWQMMSWSSACCRVNQSLKGWTRQRQLWATSFGFSSVTLVVLSSQVAGIRCASMTWQPEVKEVHGFMLGQWQALSVWHSG